MKSITPFCNINMGGAIYFVHCTLLIVRSGNWINPPPHPSPLPQGEEIKRHRGHGVGNRVYIYGAKSPFSRLLKKEEGWG